MADIRIVLVGTRRMTRGMAMDVAPQLAKGFEDIARKNPQLSLLIEKIDVEVGGNEV